MISVFNSRADQATVLCISSVPDGEVSWHYGILERFFTKPGGSDTPGMSLKILEVLPKAYPATLNPFPKPESM